MVCLLVGKSGSGKSAIAEMLVKNHGYKEVKSCTTRKPREEDIGYYFLTEEEFRRKIKNNEFVEWDMYNGDMYGTLKSELLQPVKLVDIVTIKGAENIVKLIPDAFVVHICPSMKTCVIRAIDRCKKFNLVKLESVYKRAVSDYHDYQNIQFDMLVTNERGDDLEQIAACIAKEHEKY